MVDNVAWGVETGYRDALGAWREPPAESVEAVLSSMGAEGDRRPDDRPAPVLSVRLDHPLPPLPAGRLVLEDGTALAFDGRLAPDTPTGYHRLEPDGPGVPVRLIVSPGRCPLPAAPTWGWSCQLYATRSRASWGFGDLGDLRRLGRWARSLGAGVTLVNPLHAVAPSTHPEPSPYFPSSRCFVSPLYLRIEDLPGAADLPALPELAAAGRALLAERRIDRDRVWALKSATLEALFDRFGGDPAFERFVGERGPTLRGFATFCALAERHGTPWQSWPVELRRPDGPAVAAYVADPAGARRVRYHQWLQWLLDRQLRDASEPVRVIFDLAIGVDAGGADAWLWQDTFAVGTRVGAPPDEFNTLGQDWGLPPFDPWRLRAAAYEPFVETVRAALRRAGGLRIDHVMGLFRLFWIPGDRPPAEGTYVRYPHWDLLNILALEAERADAYLIGEDLGTVEDRVRAERAERRVLSYRLWWFEPDRPPTWPSHAIGAVTTHDLPTVAGVWSGSDLEAQRRLGLAPNEEASEGLRRRLVDWTGCDETAGPGEVIEAVHGQLAAAPCLLVAATLDDAAAVEERPNMPGTTDSWPNWRLGLPLALEELERSALALDLAAELSRGRSPSVPTGPDGPDGPR